MYKVFIWSLDEVMCNDIVAVAQTIEEAREIVIKEFPELAQEIAEEPRIEDVPWVEHFEG